MTAADLAQPLSGNDFDWPTFGLQSDVRPALARSSAAGKPAALATLFRVVGSTPMGLGAQMVLADETLAGFLSGGCIEADVALHARSVLQDGQPRRLVYGEGGPLDIQLPCGSSIEILVERVAPDSPALRRLLALAEARRPAIWLSDGRTQTASALDEGGPLVAQNRSSPSDETCGELAGPFSIFRAYAPRARLIVIGSDPIALAVSQLSIDAGLETILVRPRGPRGCPLTALRYLRSEVDEAIALVGADPWTAIAVLTHGAEVEQAALTAALSTNAGYIGVIGSRRRTPARRAVLQSAGFDEQAISRIHSPIGLATGGRTPRSIALSIVAEIVGEMEGLTPWDSRSEAALHQPARLEICRR